MRRVFKAFRAYAVLPDPLVYRARLAPKVREALPVLTAEVL